MSAAEAPPGVGEGARRSAAPAAPGDGASESLQCADFATPRDAARERRFNRALLAAMLAHTGTLAALRFRARLAPTLPATLHAALPWALAALTLALLLVTAWRYVAFLRGADELLRKIQLEALGLGFATGVVLAFVYPLLEPLGAPALPLYGVAYLMVIVWGAAAVLGMRRFRGGGA